MRTVTWCVLVGLLGAAGLSGQMHREQGEAQARGGGMGGMMMGPLGEFRAFAPISLLEHADRLSLRADQIERLTALAEAAEQQLEYAHAPAQAAMQGLGRELAADAPDTAFVRQMLTAHMTAMGNMQWARLQAALEARDLLDEEQRTLAAQLSSDTAGGGQHRHRGRQQR